MFSPLGKYLCLKEKGLAKPMLTQSQASMGRHATEGMACFSPSEGTVRVSLPCARATFLESSSADAAPGYYHVQANPRDGFLIYITHQSSRCPSRSQVLQISSQFPQEPKDFTVSITHQEQTTLSTLSRFSPVCIVLLVYGAIAPSPPKLSQDKSLSLRIALSFPPRTARIPRASHNESVQDYWLPYVGRCPFGLCAWLLGIW